jgi:diguanylate cyclase (GGDEF)-like protein/PAS domain S-box-containing protein
MIIRLIKTRLAARSTAAILLLVAVLGMVFLALAMRLASVQETDRQYRQLEGLLDTVESTLQIACFLRDRELAGELVAGLMQNSTVAAVTITADDQVLSRAGESNRAAQSGDGQPEENRAELSRTIRSPFDETKIVGGIRLIPDRGVIRQEVMDSTYFVSVLLFVQMAIIGLGTAIIVVRLVTRPIARISRRLHRLKAETGEQLALPRGNEDDEIGQLVNDVNAMIDYLIQILGKERKLRLQREVEEKKFRTIFENAETAIFQVEENGRLTSFNPAFLRHFQVSEKDLHGKPQLTLYDLAGGQATLLREQVEACRRNRTNRELEFNVAEDPTRWLHLVLSYLDENLLQGVANDISERKLAEMDAERRATTDSLTGIGNRAGFDNRLARLVRQSQQRNRHFALMMMDLDFFKEVNDTYGHQAGDAVLVAVATTLRNAARKTDYVARLGGDEFVLLLDDVDSEEPATRLAEKLLEDIAQPIDIGNGVSASVGASIGIALSNREESVDDLISRADAAMYRSKQEGRNQFHTG